MSKTVTWKYKGDADVVFGEIHISKAPKIILAITVITVIAMCVTGFLLRDFIYDALTNPQIMLKNVSQDENGFYVEIPYEQDSVEFIADSYIDTINTREYDSFTNPDIKTYSFTIDGNVDTSIIGDYVVTYNSKNRVRHNSTTLTVRVKDITSPVIILKDPKTGKELAKTTDGVYYGVSLHRNTDETNNWKAEDYVMSIVDNCTELDNIQITYPEKPNFNSSTEDNITVTYIATDSSGNTSETTMKILLLKQNSTSMDLASLVDKTEQKQQLEDQTTQPRQDDNKPSGNNQQPSGGDNNNGRGDPDAGINPDDGSSTIKAPQLTADAFTWSVSSDGLYGAQFFVKAQNYLHYYNYYGTQAYPTSGPGIDFQFDVGTYTIHWEAENGLSCDQTVTITE